MLIQFLLCVISEERNMQMSFRIILGIGLANGVNISPFIDCTIRSDQQVIRNVRPIAVRPHTPGLNIFQTLFCIICGKQNPSPFMMYGDMSQLMLLVGPCLLCSPTAPWMDSHRIGVGSMDLCGHHAAYKINEGTGKYCFHNREY